MMNPIVNTHDVEISRIVVETFETMLATEVLTGDPEPSSEPLLTALVSFAGNWRGVLTFECASPPAVAFAKRFLQDETICELNGDVCDSMGELANIIAGNLKSVLTPGLSLGTPSLVDGKDYHVRFCGSHVISNCHFTTDVGAFTVRLIENCSAS